MSASGYYRERAITPAVMNAIEEVRARVGNFPYMQFRQAERLRSFVSTHRLRNCLELGFYHGVSSAYIAAMGGVLPRATLWISC